MKKNKKVLLAAGGFACVALMAGTFAWLQSNDEKTNHFEGGVAGDSDVTIVETWKPPTTWLPGQEVVKEAGILNTGQFNELVRVSFKESLELLADPDTVVSPNLPTTGDYELIPAGDLSGYNTANGWSDVVFATPITEGGYTLKGVETSKTGVDPNTGADVTAFRYIFWWENAEGDQFVARFSKVAPGDDETINENEDGRIIRNATGQVSFKDRNDINFAFVKLDYLAASLADWMTGVPSRPSAVPALTWTPAGAKSGWIGSQVDVGADKAEISIGFVNIASAIPAAAPTDPYAGTKEWVYNSADGYFYYLAVLQSGQSTENIIDKVKLDNDAGKEYTALKYDLTVRVEAIQPVEEAVKEVWGLDATNASLYTYYQGLTSGLKDTEKQ